MRQVALTFRNQSKIAPYADALREAGIEPVLVTPETPIHSLAGVAGLMLSGGTDLNPALYREQPDPRSEAPDAERDVMEQRLLREALASDVPVLAICRGMQLFNIVHEGGALAQHIEGHQVRSEDASEPVHEILVEEGTRLAGILGAGMHGVNSRHHQAVASVGRGLVVSARSMPDQVVEGLERPDLRFALAVQWHPEDQTRRLPEQRRLFEAFRDALR